MQVLNHSPIIKEILLQKLFFVLPRSFSIILLAFKVLKGSFSLQDLEISMSKLSRVARNFSKYSKSVTLGIISVSNLKKETHSQKIIQIKRKEEKEVPVYFNYKQCDSSSISPITERISP